MTWEQKGSVICLILSFTFFLLFQSEFCQMVAKFFNQPSSPNAPSKIFLTQNVLLSSDLVFRTWYIILNFLRSSYCQGLNADNWTFPVWLCQMCAFFCQLFFLYLSFFLSDSHAWRNGLHFLGFICKLVHFCKSFDLCKMSKSVFYLEFSVVWPRKLCHWPNKYFFESFFLGQTTRENSKRMPSKFKIND